MTCRSPLALALAAALPFLATACTAPGTATPVVAAVATKSLHPADYEAHLAPGALRFAPRLYSRMLGSKVRGLHQMIVFRLEKEGTPPADTPTDP